MSLGKISALKDTLLFRLTVLHAIAFVVLSFVSFLVFYYRIYSISMENVDLDLLSSIEVYTEKMPGTDIEDLWAAITEEAESENPTEEFFRLFNFSGEILASTDMSSWGNVDSYKAIEALRGGKTDPLYQTITIPSQETRARVISTIIAPGIVLQLGESLEETDEYLDVFINLFTLLIAVLIVTSTGIGWFLARRAVNDMEAVTQTAAEISNGEYDKRVRIEGKLQEIKRLGSTFNTMLDRIQVLLKTLKEMNNNIAHDLRSPLARIRGIAEMTLISDQSENDYQDMAVSTIEECDVLIEMINTMLDITEAEAGVNKIKSDEFDLAALILKACELFRHVIDEKNIHLKTSLPESLTVRNDRKKVQRVVTNILENSIKFTPEKGIVDVSAAADNGKVQIVFKDTGIGISENDLPYIFNRFYRCDQSRSQQGIGLGLSLVKAYAEAMKGSITVESKIDKGSTFTLSFYR